MRLIFKIIKNRISYLIYCICILAIAYTFDKFLQMLMFILFFNLIQDCFSKRFHSETIEDNPIKAVEYCKIITIFVGFGYLIFCKDLNISIYVNIFIIFIISLTSALLQFFLDLTMTSSCLLREPDGLILLCEIFCLTETAIRRLFLKYIKNLSNKEIAALENVEEEAIKKSIERSKKKMGIK